MIRSALMVFPTKLTGTVIALYTTDTMQTSVGEKNK
jgi:hypothetical protein